MHRASFRAFFRNPGLACAFIVAVISGCSSTLEWRELEGADNLALPHRFRIEGVPVVAQEEHQCGPAALSTLLLWNGRRDAQPEMLASELISPSKSGTLQLSLIAAARRRGFVAYILDENISSVLQEISAGNPVIVLQNLGLSWWPIWHYAVVTGFDLDRGEVTLHSGRDKPEALSFTPFENTWVRAGRWALTVVPPEKLPATAGRIHYLQAVNGLEHAEQFSAAAVGYRTALSRWPADSAASIGLANSLSSLGRENDSLEILETAAKAHPGDAAVLNNLAEARAAKGDFAAAESAAETAAAIPGPFQESAAKTLREIREKRQAAKN